MAGFSLPHPPPPIRPLLCLTSLLLVIALPPESARPTPSLGAVTDLIGPGHVGSILRTTTRNELAKLFGPGSLVDLVASGAEGEGKYPATAIRVHSHQALVVLWADQQRQQAREVWIYDPRWHIPQRGSPLACQ